MPQLSLGRRVMARHLVVLVGEAAEHDQRCDLLRTQALHSRSRYRATNGSIFGVTLLRGPVRDALPATQLRARTKMSCRPRALLVQPFPCNGRGVALPMTSPSDLPRPNAYSSSLMLAIAPRAAFPTILPS